MSVPASTRRPDGAVEVALPAGTKAGQFEVRFAGRPALVERESTRALFGDQLRSGRTTWATGLYTSGQHDIHGIQPWERDLGRWMDLSCRPSLDYRRGWGGTVNGDPGLATSVWPMTLNANQAGHNIIGMSIIPHYNADDTPFVVRDTADQADIHKRIVAGEFDWVYERIARNLTAYGLGTALVRIDWEANATWYAHGTLTVAGAALHGRAVAHAASVMLGVAPGLRFSLDVSSHLGIPDGTAEDWLDAYCPQQYAPPGKTVTHVIVVDIYFFYDRNVGQNPSYDQFSAMVHDTRWKGVTLGRAAEHAVKTGLPVGIGEWGIVNKFAQDGTTDTGKNGTGDAPAYINHMHRWLTEHPEVAYDAYWALADWGVPDLQTDLRAYYPESWAEYKRLWGRK